MTAHVVVLTVLAREKEKVGHTGEEAAMQTRYQDAEGLNLAVRQSTCGGIAASRHGPELWILSLDGLFQTSLGSSTHFR